MSQTGPADAPEGATVTYTVSYTNKALTYPAMGAQLSQIIDPQLTVDTASLGPNAHIVGNTIFWDLGNLPPRLAAGLLSWPWSTRPPRLDWS